MTRAIHEKTAWVLTRYVAVPFSLGASTVLGVRLFRGKTWEPWSPAEQVIFWSMSALGILAQEPETWKAIRRWPKLNRVLTRVVEAYDR